jgi:hypothetical protein
VGASLVRSAVEAVEGGGDAEGARLLRVALEQVRVSPQPVRAPRPAPAALPPTPPTEPDPEPEPTPSSPQEPSTPSRSASAIAATLATPASARRGPAPLALTLVPALPPAPLTAQEEAQIARIEALAQRAQEGGVAARAVAALRQTRARALEADGEARTNLLESALGVATSLLEVAGIPEVRITDRPAPRVTRAPEGAGGVA